MKEKIKHKIGCKPSYNSTCECNHCICQHEIWPNDKFNMGGHCLFCNCPYHIFQKDLPKKIRDDEIFTRAQIKIQIKLGNLPRLNKSAPLFPYKEFFKRREK